MISIIHTYKGLLLQSLGQTLLLTLLSLIFAFIIGLIFGLLSVSKSKILNCISTIYVDGIRGIPLIVLAYFIYFGIPAAIKAVGFTDFKMSALVAGTISLSMNAGAYMAEIFRAGIQSVDKGQMEAARSLGLSYGKSMKKVILPQAIRTMTPSLINQFIITLKDTSILSIIGIRELTMAGKLIIARNYESMAMWSIVALYYFIVIYGITKISRYIERKTAYGK